MSLLLALYWSFLKIGFTSFGGMSMIPLINSEMAAHNWMTTGEISDIVAIAEMTPGPLGLNCATFAGIRVAGVLGALVANFGILTPTFTVCAIAAIFFNKFRTSPIMGRVLTGVRPVCIGLIAAAVIKLIQTNYFFEGSLQWSCVAIGLVACVLLIWRKWSIPKVILVGAVMGLLLC